MTPSRFSPYARRFTVVSTGLVIGLFAIWALIALDANALTQQQADVIFTAASTDDPPGSIDPGYDKDVAGCEADVTDGDLMEVVLVNAYPSYTCTFTVTAQNTGMLPVQLGPLVIEAPPVLTVTALEDQTGLILDGGKTDVENFSVHVEQAASQNATYEFSIRKPFTLHAQGTIGFWRNWDKHNTFGEAEIEGWLVEIDAASGWFGPTTVEGMVALMEDALGKGGRPYEKFLAHCLATRLNERSGILEGADAYDVTALDSKNYLGLADPSNATLTEIIAAIESKFGTSPKNSQFNIMKNVCDALNNLQL
jgi:hypothetical protein